MSKSKKDEGSLGQLMAAGVLAGTAEIALTYPFEYLKVRSQLPPGLSNRIGPMGKTVRIYTGQLQDEQGVVSPPKALAAGLCAGFFESVILVPFEHAKIRQISSLKKPPPGTRAVFSRIFQLHGPFGLFYGFLPTLFRQGCSSALRFTAYNSLRQMASGFVTPGERMSNTMSGSIELFACYAAVLFTMPIDVVKTRVQTFSGRQAANSSSLLCAYNIFTKEGFRPLFAGLLPRIIRVSVASVLMFQIYENAYKLTTAATNLLGIESEPSSSSGGEGEQAKVRGYRVMDLAFLFVFYVFYYEEL
ncbi:mitochondrial tricarboxylate transporter [Myxozyma melibiosi]|uniref:Mitochondrial tricarboxylate transporter n=1 Tax=Myxozyma melibiosi TaxID=54550 RepID=A0ABR1FC93_9ASCO